MNILERYRVIPCAPDGGAGGGAGVAAGEGGAGGAGGAGGTAGVDAAPAAGGQPWYAALGLDAESQVYVEQKGIKDANGLIRVARDFEGIARDRNVFRRPAEGKTAEWEHWKDLGWKEKIDDYKLTPPNGLKQHEQIEPALAEAARAALHAQRVPLPAAQAVFEAVSNKLAETVRSLEAEGARVKKEQETALATALDSEWGTQKDAKIETARRAARALAGNDRDTLNALETALNGPDGKGGNVRLLKLFATLGEKIGEANLVTGDGAGAGASDNPASIKAELARLEGDANWMAVFRDPRHPQNAGYVAQRQALIKRLAAAEKK